LKELPVSSGKIWRNIAGSRPLDEGRNSCNGAGKMLRKRRETVAKYRVISFDGGGIRGLIPIILLEKIIKTPGLENLLDSVDLLAGTSTGGLIALGLAQGHSLDTLRRFYEDKGKVIFKDSWMDDFKDLVKVTGADYDIRPLRRELQSLYKKETTLGSLDKKVLITSFDLEDDGKDYGRPRWKPKLFHNFQGLNTDRDSKAVDVGLYTCAAPTFFPSVDGYVDGGVYANNPAMCALAQTQDPRYGPPAKLDEVHLLSFGTGLNLQSIKGQSLDWGYWRWAKPIIYLMLEATTEIADYQCDKILGGRYHRLAPVFPPGKMYALDDVDKIPEMRDFAMNQKIDSTVGWLKQVWMGP
jgi:hypothetical protein